MKQKLGSLVLLALVFFALAPRAEALSFHLAKAISTSYVDISGSVMDHAKQYIYFGTETYRPSIFKVRISDFIIVDGLTLVEEIAHGYQMQIDSNDEYLYMGTNTCNETGGVIAQVKLSDFSYKLLKFNSTFQKNPYSIAIDENDDFLYALTLGSTNPPTVVKILLPDFIQYDYLNVTGNWAYTCTIADNMLYATSSEPCELFKIDLASFTQVANLSMPTVEYPFSMLAHGNFLYMGTDTAPGTVAKVDLTTFDLADKLTLDSSEKYAYRITYEPTDNLFYVACFDPPKMIRLNPATFTKQDAFAYNSGYGVTSNSVIVYEADKISLYCGTYGNPAYIVSYHIHFSPTIPEGLANTLSSNFYTVIRIFSVLPIVLAAGLIALCLKRGEGFDAPQMIPILIVCVTLVIAAILMNVILSAFIV